MDPQFFQIIVLNKKTKQNSNSVFIASEQTEVVTSLKSLLKLLEASQLSPGLGGSLPHSHCDWLELHQVRPTARRLLATQAITRINSCPAPRLETLPLCV